MTSDSADSIGCLGRLFIPGATARPRARPLRPHFTLSPLLRESSPARVSRACVQACGRRGGEAHLHGAARDRSVHGDGRRRALHHPLDIRGDAADLRAPLPCPCPLSLSRVITTAELLRSRGLIGWSRAGLRGLLRGASRHPERARRRRRRPAARIGPDRRLPGPHQRRR